MKSYFHKIKKTHPNIFNIVAVYLVLGLVSLLPLLRTYGSFHVAYDTFLPFLPENSLKMTSQWLDRNNGEYLSSTYIIWIFSLSLLKNMNLSIYQVAFILQFLIYFLSGLGIYKAFNALTESKSYLALIPAIFFILSPYQLDYILYTTGTVGIVWVTYFFIKWIKKRIVSIPDVIFVSVLLLTINDLPNPKYHFLLAVIFILTILISLILKLIGIEDIKRNIKNIFILLLLSAHLIIPFLYFGYTFLGSNYEHINIKKGYASYGETLDYQLAKIQRMMRLFHNPDLNPKSSGIIVQPFFFLMYYILPIIILGIFPFIILKSSKKDKKIYLLIYFLALFLIFLSKGANPPFGFIYETLLSLPLLAFMRTTAGIIIYTAVFYALIYGLIFKYFYTQSKNKPATVILFIIPIVIWGYPFWSGKYFLKETTYLNKKDELRYGIIVPNSYFKAVEYLTPLKLDAKIDIYPSALNYQGNNWGYFGNIFYPWLIKQPTISFNKSQPSEITKSRVNTRYLFYDKSLVDDSRPIPPSISKSNSLFQSDLIDIYRKPADEFIPHFYVPSVNWITNQISSDFILAKNTDQAFFSLKNPAKLLQIVDGKTKVKPTIEYKKISTTKYRIIVHGAKRQFPLVFLENFHTQWKLYTGNVIKYRINKKNSINSVINLYHVSYLNEDDQAGKDEVIEYINHGKISTLGNIKKRKNQIFSYDNSVRSLKKVEDYNIDFISKNFKNTIQNDNLPNGLPWETFLLAKNTSPHLIVNNYFNSWIIDPQKICLKNDNCLVNPNKSYDFELIVEFWPEQIVLISRFISASTLVLILIFQTYLVFNSQRKNKHFQNKIHE